MARGLRRKEALLLRFVREWIGFPSPEGGGRRRRGRWARLALGCAVAAVFVWLFARAVDADALRRAFANLSAGAAGAALALLAAGHAMRVVRWWWMLRALEPGLPLAACIRPFLAGMAVNNVAPLRAGDALRVVAFRRQLRSPAARVLGTLIVERALDTAAMAALFFLCLSGLPEGALPPGAAAAAGWLAAAAAALLAAGFLFAAPRRAGVPRLVARLGGRWRAAAARLAEALGVVRSAPRLFALSLFSAAIWGCDGAAIVVLAAALAPGAAPAGPWLSLSAGALATAIPSGPGYVGTFDYFTALGLSAHGAAPAAAAAVALTLHALWIPFTAAGLLCLAPFARAGRGGAE